MVALCAAGWFLTALAAARAGYVAIISPLNGATVKGTITVATSEGSDVSWINVFVDGYWMGSNSPTAPRPYSVTWNTATVADGKHTLSVIGYSSSNKPFVKTSIGVTVRNLSALSTPTPTATPKPTVAPTPVAVASCISITAPAAGVTISGASVGITTHDTCPGLWFEGLYVDGAPAGDYAPGAVVLDSTSLSNGLHTIKVTSQSMNPGSVVLGSASESLRVQNGAATATLSATPNATSTPAPMPTATPAPGAHLNNLSPNAALPSESTCVTLANQANFPETSPQNVNDGTGWNANNQIWTTPSYFYANAGRNGLAPASDFAAVNGHYSGTTQDIIRWAACKWGVDEDWAYAETAEETGGWTNACAQLHGGSSCSQGGDCGNPDSNSGGETPNLSFLGFAVTDSGGAFIGTSRYGGQNANGSTCSSSWASWSIIQSKTDAFEWYTWPMLALSTAWGEDYRWAKYRACVNGDYANWFGNASDYLDAVSRARSNPDGIVPSGQAGPVNLFSNETNLQYLGLGCIATHFSGNWYDSGAISYLSNSSSGFLYHLNHAVWPGGRR